MFALGNTQILYVNKPEAVKEITTCTSWDLGKPSYQYKERRPLLGHGILTSNGASWAHQRKIIAPELYMQKVKVQLFTYDKSFHVYAGSTLSSICIITCLVGNSNRSS